MRSFLIALAAVVAAFAIAAPAQAQELTTLIAFDPSLGELPEAIAVDAGGDMYLSMASGEVKRVTPDGEASTFAMLPSPGSEGFFTGLAFNSSGDLFACLGTFDPETHGIWRITPDGESELFASLDTAALPNGITFDGADTMFVSDTFGGQILTISPDAEVNTWSGDPLLEPVQIDPLPFPTGPNGIAFDATGDNLYVVTTGNGRVVSIPVEVDGSAGAATLVAEDVDTLGGADGIAFDSAGTLYVTLITQDGLATVDPDGTLTTVIDGSPLQNPSDIAFGVGENADRYFITNFAAFRALGLQEGAPQPALLALASGDAADEPSLPPSGTGFEPDGGSSLWLVAIGLAVVGALAVGAANRARRAR